MNAQASSRTAAQRTSVAVRCLTCDQAATRLYEAEVALHHARQTGVDKWVAAAADRLHEAVVAHRNARADHRFLTQPALS